MYSYDGKLRYMPRMHSYGAKLRYVTRMYSYGAKIRTIKGGRVLLPPCFQIFFTIDSYRKHAY